MRSLSILTRGSMPSCSRSSHRMTGSDQERLPAYSGATVPDFHRVPDASARFMIYGDDAVPFSERGRTRREAEATRKNFVS